MRRLFLSLALTLALLGSVGMTGTAHAGKRPTPNGYAYCVNTISKTVASSVYEYVYDTYGNSLYVQTRMEQKFDQTYTSMWCGQTRAVLYGKCNNALVCNNLHYSDVINGYSPQSQGDYYNFSLNAGQSYTLYGPWTSTTSQTGLTAAGSWDSYGHVLYVSN